MTAPSSNIGDSLSLGTLTFNPADKTLAGCEATVALEDKVAELLEYLWQRKGEVVSKEDMLETIWSGRSLSDQTVPVAISKIRKAIRETGGGDDLLQTVPKRGYRLVAEEAGPAETNALAAPRNSIRTWFLISLPIILVIVATLWPERAPLVPAAGAEKPGLILTMKDIRTESEAREDGASVIALSELASYYLSQTPEVLLIRHWWNVDAPDPTGGIYTRYGADTPVYLLTGTLLNDGDRKVVALSLSNPRTDEVIWSGLHNVASGSESYFRTLADMYQSVGILPRATIAQAGQEDHRYWVGRYLMHLSSEGAAAGAADTWRALLEENPGDETVRRAFTALAARWQGIEVGDYASPETSDGTSADDYQALVDRAAIAFFLSGDPSTALTLLERAIDQAPGDHYAWSLKAEVLAAKGDLPAALETYRKAARLAPFASAYADRIAVLSP